MQMRAQTDPRFLRRQRNHPGLLRRQEKRRGHKEVPWMQKIT